MNDFAINSVQSLFENMLNVPQPELETTVMRFREEVKNLGEPERFAVTGDLVLRVQELAWELGDRFGLDCMNLDELEFNLLDFESQMTEKEKQKEIARLEQAMAKASKMLEFEYAAVLRDRIIELRGEKTKK